MWSYPRVTARLNQSAKNEIHRTNFETTDQLTPDGNADTARDRHLQGPSRAVLTALRGEHFLGGDCGSGMTVR